MAQTLILNGTPDTLAQTWAVIQYMINSDQPNQPPIIFAIVACPWPDTVTMVEASKNSEWQKYVTKDRPVLAEVLFTGTKIECMQAASRFVVQREPHCQRFGAQMSHRTARLMCSNGQTYATQSEAAQLLGLNQGAISQHLKGKLRHVKGYTFHLER